jgi:hypothetical protein
MPVKTILTGIFPKFYSVYHATWFNRVINHKRFLKLKIFESWICALIEITSMELFMMTVNFIEKKSEGIFK